ncbi:helix-turn-helix domain-containing protein [Streptomyces sp. NBC_01429]|uniref:helix-turn-helix domain-containing protein n=1 Tax=Streptomyces sp. NBC_01429 TaxID=2903862 RepID=UPI002E29D6CB|nr:XRE family transcriptional regulator [Streptomyces sp. NBC_01429]
MADTRTTGTGAGEGEHPAARTEPDDGGFTTVLTGVGPRLRAIRRDRGTTLSRLSEVTGISLSTLSRLESGQRKPTLELLLPLAKAYGVQLDELVNAPRTGDPRVHFRPFTRHGMTFLPLTRHLGGVQAYKLIIPAGRQLQGEPEQKVHEGYEWMYVLAGRLRLFLGEHDLTLTPGEVVEFDTRTPHAWTSAGPEAVEVLSLFGPQGERMHARARPAGQ